MESAELVPWDKQKSNVAQLYSPPGSQEMVPLQGSREWQDPEHPRQRTASLAPTLHQIHIFEIEKKIPTHTDINFCPTTVTDRQIFLIHLLNPKWLRQHMCSGLSPGRVLVWEWTRYYRVWQIRNSMTDLTQRKVILFLEDSSVGKVAANIFFSRL